MSPNRAFGSGPASRVPLHNGGGQGRRGLPEHSRREERYSLLVPQSVYELEIWSGSARNWRQEPNPIAILGGCFSCQRLQRQVGDHPPQRRTFLPGQIGRSAEEIVVEFQGRPHTSSVAHHASI